MITLDCHDFDRLDDEPVIRVVGDYDMTESHKVGVVQVVADLNWEQLGGEFCPVTVCLHALSGYDEDTCYYTVSTPVEPSSFDEGPELVAAGVLMVAEEFDKTARGRLQAMLARPTQLSAELLDDIVEDLRIAASIRCRIDRAPAA